MGPRLFPDRRLYGLAAPAAPSSFAISSSPSGSQKAYSWQRHRPPKLMALVLNPNPQRVGHSWDAAPPSIAATSVSAGHTSGTDLSRHGL
jgi:hypothetical protein